MNSKADPQQATSSIFTLLGGVFIAILAIPLFFGELAFAVYQLARVWLSAVSAMEVVAAVFAMILVLAVLLYRKHKAVTSL